METPKKPIELVRLQNNTHPLRQTVNEQIGWKPGTEKVMIVLREMDSFQPRKSGILPWISGHIVAPIYNIAGIIGRRHFHFTIVHIDKSGNWKGADPRGPLSERIHSSSFTNRNTVLIPIEMSESKMEEVSKNIDQSLHMIMAL